MCNSTLSHLPIECQTIPSCDAAATLREARADALRARARQCRAQAWGITFIIDACDDERTVAAWLAERETLLREADVIEKGCES